MKLGVEGALLCPLFLLLGCGGGGAASATKSALPNGMLLL